MSLQRKPNPNSLMQYTEISVPDGWRKPEQFHNEFIELVKERGWECTHPATIFENAIEPIVKLIKRQYNCNPTPSNQWYPYYQTVVYCEEQGYFNIENYYQGNTK